MNFINILGFYAFRTEKWFIGWIMNGCFYVDRAIYFILEKVYILFYYLCNINISTISNLFTNLIDRVFALVGVVLLFALALKIMDAIVNPDGSFIKNSKQFGITLFTTVAILMLTMPISGNRGIIFRYLDEIEDVFLPSKDDTGLIMRILFGGGSDNLQNVSNETYGRQMAKTILMQFIVIDDNAGDKVKYIYNDIKNCNSDRECNYGDLGDILNKKEIAYYPFVSGLAGIYMVYILIKFSLTAVRRCFELLVLEVLTPVFVLFRLDDKTKNIWNSFVSRYKDVFIKLFVLTFSFYFGIMLMNNILVFASKNVWGSDSNTAIYETTNSAATSLLAMNVSAAEMETPQGFTGKLFTIVLIVGVFGFVSSMPDVICGLLGIKNDEKTPSFGSFLGGAVGGFLGGAKAVGGAALGFGLDKATHGKFGEFVVNKVGTIKEAFGNTSFTGGIQRRYDEKRRQREAAELRAERENIQNIYNALTQSTAQPSQSATSDSNQTVIPNSGQTTRSNSSQTTRFNSSQTSTSSSNQRVVPNSSQTSRPSFSMNNSQTPVSAGNANSSTPVQTETRTQTEIFNPLNEQEFNRMQILQADLDNPEYNDNSQYARNMQQEYDELRSRYDSYGTETSKQNDLLSQALSQNEMDRYRTLLRHQEDIEYQMQNPDAYNAEMSELSDLMQKVSRQEQINGLSQKYQSFGSEEQRQALFTEAFTSEEISELRDLKNHMEDKEYRINNENTFEQEFNRYKELMEKASMQVEINEMQKYYESLGSLEERQELFTKALNIDEINEFRDLKNHIDNKEYRRSNSSAFEQDFKRYKELNDKVVAKQRELENLVSQPNHEQNLVSQPNLGQDFARQSAVRDIFNDRNTDNYV